MSATIFVKNLIISGTHGAHLPTAKPKDFKIDMECEIADITEAVATDNIANVYDYREAVAIARRIIQGSPVHLIETLASRIAREVLNHPKVQKITLHIQKREGGDAFDSGISLTVASPQK